MYEHVGWRRERPCRAKASSEGGTKRPAAADRLPHGEAARTRRTNEREPSTHEPRKLWSVRGPPPPREREHKYCGKNSDARPTRGDSANEDERVTHPRERTRQRKCAKPLARDRRTDANNTSARDQKNVACRGAGSPNKNSQQTMSNTRPGED